VRWFLLECFQNFDADRGLAGDDQQVIVRRDQCATGFGCEGFGSCGGFVKRIAHQTDLDERPAECLSGFLFDLRGRQWHKDGGLQLVAEGCDRDALRVVASGGCDDWARESGFSGVSESIL